VVCHKVLTWMLAAAKPEEPPDAVLRHLAACPHCRQEWQRLIRLEALLAGVAEEGLEQSSLERFLHQHGFAPVPSGGNAASVTVPSTVHTRDRGSRRHRRLTWTIMTCAAGLVAAIFVVCLILGLPRSPIGDLAEKDSAAQQHDVGPSAAEGRTPVDGTSARSPSPQSTTAALGHGQPSSPERVAAGQSDPLPTATAPAHVPAVAPLNSQQLLARAESEMQLLWRMLDQTLPLLDTVEPKARLIGMLELATLLAEEARHQAKEESVARCVEATALFERSVAAIPRLARRLPAADQPELVGQCRHRLAALADSVRAEALQQPRSLADPLRQLAETAHRTAETLDKLVPGSGRHPDDPQRSAGGSLSARIDSAAESPARAKIFSDSANASDPFFVVFTADEETSAPGEGNLTAYLLGLSLRQELLKLVLGCASRLCEQDDSRQRVEIGLDLAEGLVRLLAVVSGAGPSPLSVRIGEYLGAALARTVRGNWPSHDTASDARSPSRQQAWKETEQRLTDLVTVLRMETAELPEEARRAWDRAMAAAESGIAEAELALLHGPPQPPPPPEPPAKPSSPMPKPTVPALPTRPVAKPIPEPPAKPEKPKPVKPPFKPGKPFPDRFKDIKDLWHGKKR
jgi:hypothetical protein